MAFTPAAAEAAAKRCGGLTESGQQVTVLRATGVGCTNARRLARAWVRSDECNPTVGNPEECIVRRYRCTTTHGPGFSTTVVCRRSGRRVSFRVG